MALRQRRALVLVALVVGTAGLARAEDASEARLRKDITYLASDACEGRGVATKGVHLAADYIAAEFKKAGLKPAGKDGSYFQPFTINGGTLEAEPHLLLRGPQGQEIVLKAGLHFEAMGISHPGQLDDVPLVFAGYGISLAEGVKDAGGNVVKYDDYQDLDVRDKVVVVLRDRPRAGHEFLALGGARARFQSLGSKMDNAQKHGAKAVLFVNDRNLAKTADELMYFSMTAADSSPAKLPALQLSRSVLGDLLRGQPGGGLAEREQDIDRELKPHSTALDGWTVGLEVKVRRSIDAKNVVGVLEGAGPLAKETVVVGAHYDHLGYGGSGSLNRTRKPSIHHGADDNGSGTTAVLELARRFGAVKGREGRRLVFIAFSGEELGLLGSAHYCKNPLFPLEDTAAMINLDMVGRMAKDEETKKEKLIVYGVGSAKMFEELVTGLGKKHDLKLHLAKDRTFAQSDHYSFYAKQVPVLFLFTGDHPDYHRPSDTSEKINIAGMGRIVDWTQGAAEHLATVMERPKYVKIAGGSSPTPGEGPRFGIQPKYGDEKEGVYLNGVTEGGPAAKAGLKEGDRIVEIAGKKVKDVETYMEILFTLKAGEPVDVKYQRDGKTSAIKVTPQ